MGALREDVMAEGVELDKLHTLSLREAAQHIREGRLTSVEVTRACLARCARLEPRVQAWEYLAPERAMEQAEVRDAALQAGDAPGPLHGVPLGIKDIIDVAGMPTTMGSEVYAGAIADTSASIVLSLEAAGAVILGKTVTTEFAYYTPNKTRNPWNPEHTPGGSSMGSAAAVAAGMACAALGSQTNGSVIRPAAFCGVVGFKPTLGVIPLDGVLAFAGTLDTIGVFARSVPDAARVASVIAAPEGLVPGSIPALSGPPRLAAVRSPVWDSADDIGRRAFAEAIAALRRAGASVDEVELPRPFEQGHDAHRAIMAYEGALNMGDMQRRYRDRLSARLNLLLDEGAAIPRARYESALTTRSRLQEAYAAFLEGYAALITPPAPGEAPATLDETGNPVFCTLWTLLGVPAITVPAGRGARGLPLGLQIVGAPRHDAALLSLAMWCEQALPRPGMPD